MAKGVIRALEGQLGAAPPPGLAKLSDAQLKDLTGAIEFARRRQARELAAAGDQAFRHVPRLLRTPIRKLLG